MPVCKRMKNLQLDDSKDMDDEDSSDEGEYSGHLQSVSRAEKSRCAAKMRRDKEGIEMERLSTCLPFSQEMISKLDKGAVIRLAIAYIRMKHYAQKDMGNNTDASMAPASKKKRKLLVPVENTLTNDKAYGVGEEGTMMLEALNGFLIFISKKQKKVHFVSDNVEEYLGHTQANMIGKTVRDFMHPSDHKELDKHFIIQPKAKDANKRQSSESMEMDVNSEDILCQDHKRVFYLKMKFHMMKKGTKTRHSGFTLVQWSGRLKLRLSSKPQGYSVDGLLCICRPMQTNSILEIRMDGNMFMSRHELDMRFTFCDPRIITLIGYEPGDLIGKTAYQFHNPLDAKKIHNCHSTLIVKGTSVSKYYRFLGKSGDWVWMQTRATIIYNTSSSPQYVVCMNYVISEEEGQRYLMMETEQAGLQLPNIRGSIELNCCGKALTSCDNCGNSDHISDHSDGGYGSSYSPYSSSSSQSNPSPVSIETKDCNGTDINAQEAVFHVTPNTPDFTCLSDTNCLIDTLQVSTDFPTSTGTVKIEMAKEDEETLDEILGSFSEEDMVTTQSSTMVSNIPTAVSISRTFENLSKPNENKPSLLRLLLNPKEDSVMSHPACLPTMAATSSTFSVPACSVTNTINMSAMDLDPEGANTGMRITNMDIEGSQRLRSDPLVSSIVPFPRTFGPTRTHDSQNFLTSQINEFSLPENSAKPSLSTSLPDDLVDLAMNFCDSLADDQAQAVMAELGQDVWMGDIGDFGEDTVPGLEKTFINGNMMSEQPINLLFPDIPTSFISNNPPLVCNSLGQSVLSDCNLGHTVNSNSLDNQQISSKIAQKNFTFGQLKHRNSRASSCTSPTSNTHSTSCLSAQYNFDTACSSASHSPQLNTNLLQDRIIQEDQSMTELEKHLRGYIPPNLSTKQSSDTVYEALNNFSVAQQHDVNDSKPLLQKFLTGELSKELYHAMERQRYMRDRITPVLTSPTNVQR